MSWRDVPCPISPSHPIGREVATAKRNLDPLAGRLVVFVYDKPQFFNWGGLLHSRGVINTNLAGIITIWLLPKNRVSHETIGFYVFPIQTIGTSIRDGQKFNGKLPRVRMTARHNKTWQIHRLRTSRSFWANPCNSSQESRRETDHFSMVRHAEIGSYWCALGNSLRDYKCPEPGTGTGKIRWLRVGSPKFSLVYQWNPMDIC